VGCCRRLFVSAFGRLASAADRASDRRHCRNARVHAAHAALDGGASCAELTDGAGGAELGGDAAVATSDLVEGAFNSNLGRRAQTSARIEHEFQLGTLGDELAVSLAEGFQLSA